MAHYHMLRSHHELASLWIDDTVGRTRNGDFGANRTEDVMLVQVLLVRALAGADYLGPRLQVDGVYGALTDYCLCRFLINHDWPFERPTQGDNLLLTPQGVGMGTMQMTLLGWIKVAEYPSLFTRMPTLLQEALKKNTTLHDRDLPLTPMHPHLSR
jgi:hypothetical protein